MFATVARPQSLDCGDLMSMVGVGVSITVPTGFVAAASGLPEQPDPDGLLLWKDQPLQWKGQSLVWK